MTMNKIIVVGNVGRDPEMRYTPNGQAVTSFSVATNYRYTTGEGEQREETEWFNVVTWRQLAERCSQYLQKGRKVYIEGRMQTRSWDDQEGQKRYRTEVIAFDVQFLDSRADREYDGAPAGEGEVAPAGAGEVDPDEIPF